MNLAKARRICLALLGLVGGMACFALHGFAKPLADSVFAEVNGTVISEDEYRTYLQGRSRQKYYHGKVPGPEASSFRNGVIEDLVQRALLSQEAERRGIGPDEKAVEKQVRRIDARYADEPQWAEQRSALLAAARGYLRTDSKIARLEARVRHVAPPDESTLRAYYRDHADKFTVPEQYQLSLILHRVPPSALPEEWEAAKREVDAWAARIASGEDFSLLARTHSQDASANEGGNLGFVHRDMLADTVQQALDTLAIGEVSPPLLLLEGYALFRLDGRAPARMNTFETVRDRAQSLWMRDAGDRAWNALIESLKASAHIRITESFLAEAGDQAQPSGRGN